jgi:hypothetical protein
VFPTTVAAYGAWERSQEAAAARTRQRNEPVLSIIAHSAWPSRWGRAELRLIGTGRML